MSLVVERVSKQFGRFPALRVARAALEAGGRIILLHETIDVIRNHVERDDACPARAQYCKRRDDRIFTASLRDFSERLSFDRGVRAVIGDANAVCTTASRKVLAHFLENSLASRGICESRAS